MKVTKKIEWDMGHRITNHNSQCRNLHGHRYVAEICVEGDLVKVNGDSSEGMVIDFGDIKKIAMKQIHDVLDHGFMVWEKDKVLLDFFSNNKDQKHIIVPFVSTSENIAAWIFLELDKSFKDRFGTGLKLYSIRLWETPTGSAICTKKDIKEDKA
ncbi:6-carboxytetrahydropterin synthase [Patescibacteria group bacterium]|nr:6-carboxytetrahydropterin synthase [Patescibacteria group bacterium]